MSTFTPGPWDSRDCAGWEVFAADTAIADCQPCLPSCVRDPDDATAEANAHLIAAAPDLYEACRAAISTRGMGGPAEVYERIRAALAKAEGR